MANNLTDQEIEALILEHRQLAINIARGHRNWASANRPDVDDLEGEALLELCRAARDWDESRSPFRPYVIRRIRWRLQLADQAATYPVKLPDGAHAYIQKIRRANLAGAKTAAEVSAVTGISEQKVSELWPYLQTGRLDLSVAESVPSGSDVPEDIVIREIERANVREVVDSLPSPAKEIVWSRWRFNGDGPIRLDSEIAEELGLPVEQVRHIEESAWAVIRERLHHLDVPDA